MSMAPRPNTTVRSIPASLAAPILVAAVRGVMTQRRPWFKQRGGSRMSRAADGAHVLV
jgi:hypothetical protein